MICKGEFIYRGLKKVEKGSFNDKLTGEKIEYDECFKLQLDESTEKGQQAREFKISKDNVSLIKMFKDIDLYSHIEVEFNILVFTNRTSLVPTFVTVL